MQSAKQSGPPLHLAGLAFVFDYGEIARYLLRFTAKGSVEVTNLLGPAYSMEQTDIFPVEVDPDNCHRLHIAWENAVEKTHLTHIADLNRRTTSVTIEDAMLAETRRYDGVILDG